MIRDKKSTSLKWIDKVFKGLDELERDILFHIEQSSFDVNSLDKKIDKLRQHYGAVSNLKKSFDNNSFFIGYIE